MATERQREVVLRLSTPGVAAYISGFAALGFAAWLSTLPAVRSTPYARGVLIGAGGLSLVAGCVPVALGLPWRDRSIVEMLRSSLADDRERAAEAGARDVVRGLAESVVAAGISLRVVVHGSATTLFADAENVEGGLQWHLWRFGVEGVSSDVRETARLLSAVLGGLMVVTAAGYPWPAQLAVSVQASALLLDGGVVIWGALQ